MKTIEIDGKEYEIIGYGENGLPTIRGIATTTEDGVDTNGNPIKSVNIAVPAAELFAVPGKVE